MSLSHQAGGDRALRGSGVFSTFDAEFAEFLSTEGEGPGTQAFVARNFLIDEGVLLERAQSYRDSGVVAGHGSHGDWQRQHGLYLSKRVQLPHRDTPPSALLDPADIDGCPETFRYIPADSPFLSSELGLELVRVEEVSFISRTTGAAAERVKSLALRVTQGADGGPDAARDLDAILVRWLKECDKRPVFAGFWQDLHDVFGATPLEDNPGWPDGLRDRLGLVHLQPDEGGLPRDIIVFRYPVSELAHIVGHQDVRPLVPPTVLDGGDSRAFCPAPRNTMTGHTVDLGQLDSPVWREVCREVLHPAFHYRARHVWRVGAITSAVPEEALSRARQLHLMWVREESGRDDYASGTDP